jgi:xanthine dehydrogenase YagS FAD-binding subunit
MQAFEYVRAADIDAALAGLSRPGTKLLAGGTNLLDLMKGCVERPVRLVDIRRLPLAEVTRLANGGVRIGALATNSDVANHPLIRTRYPLLAEALLSGASAQLRNMATVAGNLMQRTRCPYFYDSVFAACNKRIPGSGCAALGGHQRMHAIFGASEHCIATHPSDMAVALTALDAVVEVRSAASLRRIPVCEFHRLPANRPDLDTILEPHELIAAVELPEARFVEHRHYLKIRDRASFAFALISVAVGLELDEGAVRDVRIVLGGVAHKPWRAEDAEHHLRDQPLSAERVDAASRMAVAGAKPLAGNAFKVDLARRAVVQALRAASGQP